MIQKKICLIGSYSVGKTSLVKRFVTSLFSAQYHTTLAVKVDKKQVALDGVDVNMVIWDLAGEDPFQKLQMSYLRGTAGYLLVCDGTRRATLDKACELRRRIEKEVAAVPFVLVVNKSDLADSWEIDAEELADLASSGWQIIRSSAKTGEGVEEAFLELARAMVAPDSGHQGGLF